MLSLSVGFLIAVLHFVEPFMDLQPKCEPIKTPLCRDLGKYYNNERMYNMTIYPNSLDHRNQNEAGLELNQYSPLIQVNCSKHMLLFLCTVYAPMCSKPLILPCRSLCEEVRDGCLPLMQTYGFEWPDALKCSKFQRKSKGLCFGGPSKNTEDDKGEKKQTCQDCLENSTDRRKLKNLCDRNDMVLVGKVLNIREGRRVKFRVKQEIIVKGDLGKVIKKRLKQKKMMVKLSFPKKACVGKCDKFEKGKSYVLFLKVKKRKRAVYNQAGVMLYKKGMKIC